MQPVLCPVHLYARLLCSADCAAARNEMRLINAGYRQYWYDRRRGVPPMDHRQFVRLQAAYARRRPIWLVWRVA